MSSINKRLQSIAVPSKSKAISKKSVASSVHFEENYIKRERMRREETCKEISKMRAELPEYTINDIRMWAFNLLIIVKYFKAPKQV